MPDSKAPKDFDDAMARMGVRPIDRSGLKDGSSRRQKAPPKLVAKTPSVEPTPPALPVLQSTAGVAELQELRRELDAWRGRALDAERELETHAPWLAAGLPGGAAAQLDQLLVDRGLRRGEESENALASLLRLKEFQPLMTQLIASTPAQTRAFLDDRLLLLCEAHAGLNPQGRSLVKTVADRCDVCGGAELNGLVKRAQEALIVHGLFQIELLGAPPSRGRIVTQLLGHPRLRFRVIGTLGAREPSSAVLSWAIPSTATDSATPGGVTIRVPGLRVAEALQAVVDYFAASEVDTTVT